MATVESLDEDLPDTLFDHPYNEGLIHQAVVAYRSRQRAGTASTKNRSDVSGANSKPWRQKGTGRARHGSRISPLWVGGGQVHTPDGRRNHAKKLPRSMRQRALASALSFRRREGKIYRLDPPELSTPSTSTMQDVFDDADLTDETILLLHTPGERNLRLSVRNLPFCDPFDAESLNVYEVVDHSAIAMTPDALERLRVRENANGS